MGHDFEYVQDLPLVLPQALAKELFMANLGLTGIENSSEFQSSSLSSTSTQFTRITRQSKHRRRSGPYGMLQGFILRVQKKLAKNVVEIQKLRNKKVAKPREQTVQRMRLWLMDLPKEFELARFSTSALRCNECLMCQGVEYPCDRCKQQYHQECHPDQGRPRSHRLCPSCTRQNTTQPPDALN